MNIRFHPKVTDQMAHFAAAVLILAIASIGTIWAGALAGLALGLIRETAEGVRRMTIASVVTQLCKRDSQIDLVFWTLGGAVSAAVM